ncbi:FAD-binding and (Fe-S)-binding domain-containing protein [Psychromonas sp. 14N.309.X.WAT.B.A12]|uniref:D-2-hydroxyglutarate dehydrogenase YdiJ n=1 Tax=Psychromonas sp. 14N.309.X.WAT.B.A12 TaxID=2998322 RepID=UPI0025AFF1E2|nr:FAD-binding and (Fe-S)-binding domain-containing protein [Psychromonas sp. 14N.309.X.WAT.B.A12]MDN2662582.1 FAD-binding and (Fe-S)-binding domain-containing protein [Psychromonas sp. 14N.309.X.WAT.B.A12]
MIPNLNHQENIKQDTFSFIKALSESDYSGEIAKSYASRLAAATDNSVYQCLPQAVIFPKSTQDIVAICQLAQSAEFEDIRFSPRGGGTGTNGQSLTNDIVLDLSKYMNNVLEINAEEGWVRVQTGVVKDQLNEYLKPHGLFFSPDLSTSNRATIGGMISNDASGQGSLIYGKTSDHVLALTSVLIDGSVLESKPLTALDLIDQVERQDSIGAIYRQVIDTCETQLQNIEDTFPKLNRFLTGYDLKHVYDHETGTVDLTRILCGAEGSLAFITEATLHVQPIPTYRTLFNIKYDSFQSALQNAPFLVKANALSVETVDSKVLNLAKQDIVWHSVKDLISDVPGQVLDGINIVEFAEADETIQQQKIDALIVMLDGLIENKQAGVIGYQICSDLADINRIYGMRKKAVGLLGKADSRAKPIAFAEDTCVPPENLAEYIIEFRQLLDDKGLHYGMFGHVDAGVLHVRPALDLCDPEQEKLMREISDKVVALTAKYKGLMWGEHGKGFRSEYGPDFFGNELFTELRKIKTVFDPHNRVNPGKICTPIDSTESLVSVDAAKRGTFDRQIPIQVRESYAQALDCNGNGLCFNYDTKSPMCPSVKVTRDRVHSPKGRAGLMREWLRQLANNDIDILQLESDLYAGKNASIFTKFKNTLAKRGGEYDFSHEVMEAMQGCLACKACSSQCPIQVDVPAFRSRFIHLYHDRYLRPVKDYFVAYVEQYAPLMGKMPRFFNFFTGLKVTSALTEKVVGMVDIPQLSSPTLKTALQDNDIVEFDLGKLQALSKEEREQYVLVVQDPFTTFYDADVVRDLFLTIKKLGFKPVLLPFKPNGKPQHIKGFLTKFAKTAEDSAAFLNQMAALDIAMVGTDPAMVLCYRDEYKQALGEKRGEFNVQLFQEWLKPRLSGEAKTSQNSHFYLLGHCTEKTAEPTSGNDWATIFSHFGGTLSNVAVGCCGMAGTYGHDAGKLADSKAIYSLSWEAEIAKHDRAQCLATGYSCRSQVKRIEGETLKHPVQALLTLL